MSGRKAIHKDFFKKWTSDMAYVLGFFAADGCITVNCRGGQFWSIQITDGAILEEIKKVIKSDHKISVRVGRGNESDLFRIQVGSKEMCDDLRKLGLYERKTKSLTVPCVPEKYFMHFVRGYFDGDGNVWSGYHNTARKNPTRGIMVAFTSCSRLFLEELKARLIEVGLEKGGVYTSRGNYFRLQYSTRDSLKLYDFMYNRVGASKLFLERKKKVFQQYKAY